MNNKQLYIVILTGLLVVFFLRPAYSTHNRAGEITYEVVEGLTYKITITTFTYTLSAADRSELEVMWGDNTTSIAPRDEGLTVFLPNFYKKNIYFATHTFPGPGKYEIIVQDPNRNFGVKNIPNSVNTIFSIKTTLIISPDAGNNSTPQLLNPPIDQAAINHVFIHNPGAFDPDGDSISYSLGVCTEEDGEPIEGYELPEASNSIYVDPVTGDFVWNTPVDTGIYNVAINITEWRNNIRIGNIVRDMQIDVYDTDNKPPVNDTLIDYCLVAGEKLTFQARATDPDGDSVIHSFTGGPLVLEDSPMLVEKSVFADDEAVSTLSWVTNCSHVRLQPYTIIVKATDNNPDLSLVDIDRMNIRVIAPPVEGLTAFAGNNSIRLAWSTSNCSNASGYQVYRSNLPYTFENDSCITGIPDDSGYKLIGTLNNINDTTFLDDNNGKGLQQGLDYCYRVVATFPDGAESIASGEVCVSLVPGLPAILNTSVIESDESTGKIFLSWAKPKKLDTIPANGPYEYKIFRSPDLWGENLQEIYSFQTSNLDDTTYVDDNLNTIQFPYTYKVELYNNEPGNVFLIGEPEIASTLYPSLIGKDNRIDMEFIKNVPWLNTRYTVLRKTGGNAFDSLTTVSADEFVDLNLTNGLNYCYQLESYGWRMIDSVVYENYNISHINCTTPIDSIPPCPPGLDVKANCDSLLHAITWNPRELPCSDDVIKYNLYYSPVINGDMEILYESENQYDTTFIHFPEVSMAGCYAVTAIDSFNNESDPSVKICVDECTDYELPNVFTPNNDGINDLFRPKNYHFVERVNMQIFNRWGNLVFETTDPIINWDGTIQNTGRLASPGIYYYICDVFEYRLTGIEARNLAGFVYLFTDKNAAFPNE
jgi:gliding motility-associated-like protein